MIIYLHDLRHSCLPFLAELLEGKLLYGSVARCPDCKRAWMLTPHKPWLRRRIVNRAGYGFWVREPWHRRRDRIRDDGETLIDDLHALLACADERR